MTAVRWWCESGCEKNKPFDQWEECGNVRGAGETKNLEGGIFDRVGKKRLLRCPVRVGTYEHHETERGGFRTVNRRDV